MAKKKSGGAAPYGYRRTDAGFELHPEEAPIRKLIFELFLKHKKKLKVVNILNEQGYRTRNGSLFSDSSVSRYLIDPIVKGHHRDNFKKSSKRKRYRNLKPEPDRPYSAIEPIIDDTTWNQVDDILHNQKNNPATKTPRGTFGGLLTCKCGAGMHYPHGRNAYFCKSCDNRIEVETIDAIFSGKLEGFKLDEIGSLSDVWPKLSPTKQKELANLITHKIAVGISTVKITFALSPSSF
jgi:site-specific DNA recombinase